MAPDWVSTDLKMCKRYTQLANPSVKWLLAHDHHRVADIERCSVGSH